MSDPHPVAVFCYDLSSPEAYVAAERVHDVLPVVAEWEPVLAAGLDGPAGALAEAEIERRAAERGLQPLRWPPTRAPDARAAMLAATYAKQVGRAVAFSLAAFRQTFAAGRDLADRETILIAAAACEMHPAAVLKALALRSVAGALDAATTRARIAGVTRIPAILIGERAFLGDGGLDAAAAALATISRRPAPPSR